MWKKCGKKSKKCEKMWWTHLEIHLGRWNSDFFFFRFDFFAQLLQVENRRGAVQIDRKWTVQIADLLNLAIAKQWLPGAKTSNQMKKEKRTKPQNCFKKYIFYMFSHFFTFLKHMFFTFQKYCILKSHFFHIFNSNYYNPSVAQLAFINVCVKHMSYI